MRKYCDECEWAYMVLNPETNERVLMCEQKVGSISTADTEDEKQVIFSEHNYIPCKKFKKKWSDNFEQKTYRSFMLDKFKLARKKKRK